MTGLLKKQANVHLPIKLKGNSERSSVDSMNSLGA